MDSDIMESELMKDHGEDQHEESQVPVQQVADDKPTNNNVISSKTVWLIVGLITLVAMAIGAVAIFVIGSNSNLALFQGGSAWEAAEFVRMQDDFMLRGDDLTANYYVESGGEKRRGNRLIILEMGEIAGKQYVLDTGRLDGWYINLRKSDRTDIAPSTYTQTIDVYEDKQGALLALSPAYFKAYTDDTRDYEFLDKSCSYGNKCILYTTFKFDPATGLTVIRYDVAYVYDNVLVWISATGLNIDISEDDIHEAAQIVLDKLEGFERS